jgi:hypothetical protein
MKKLSLLIIFFALNVSWGCESNPVDILLVGDSQTGASWSKSYFGNFVQECLGDSFTVYGRGGTSPSSWVGKGNLDNVETIMRSPIHRQLNLGSGDQVQLCQKRLLPMIEAHKPKKLLLFFGDNLIASSDEEIVSQLEKTMKTIEESGLSPKDCYFLTPTYEMEVATKRNVTRKNFENTLRITLAIKKTIIGHCQHINGLELMKSSAYLTKNQLLKRVEIPGLTGCGGAAVNDNIHVCGQAARDLANKVCELFK